jgi:hypothetical protein
MEHYMNNTNTIKNIRNVNLFRNWSENSGSGKKYSEILGNFMIYHETTEKIGRVPKSRKFCKKR